MTEAVKDRLPNDPGDLLELSIVEFERVRRLPGVGIDMGDWLLLRAVDIDDSKFRPCVVCLAGGVMMSLVDLAPLRVEAGSTTRHYSPEDLASMGLITYGDARKLAALNQYRAGFLGNGLYRTACLTRTMPAAHPVTLAAQAWLAELPEYSPDVYAGLLYSEPDFSAENPEPFLRYLRDLIAAWRKVPGVLRNATHDLIVQNLHLRIAGNV